MKNVITMTTMLFLAAAGTTPTQANYFHNPHLNIIRNVGSAPSPTPQDVRENRLPRFADNDRSQVGEVVASAVDKSGKSGKANLTRTEESD